MTSDDTAQAPGNLKIEVYTAPGRTFVSAIAPQGPGDEPTWSPSSATLIYGDHDAVLVIRIGRADTANSTVLHVPSLGAVVTGDLAYNGVHMMTAEAGEPERAEWIANLDIAATLKPSIVVAGHKRVENDNDPKIISESQQYLRDFSRIIAEETTVAGIVAKMVERYPDWANGRTLWHSARTAVARKSS
jgi:hypothetical protein